MSRSRGDPVLVVGPVFMGLNLVVGSDLMVGPVLVVDPVLVTCQP